jgi:hypothetical protein
MTTGRFHMAQVPLPLNHLLRRVVDTEAALRD